MAWHWFLRSLIQRHLRRAVYEAAARTASEHVSRAAEADSAQADSEQGEDSGPSRRCDVGIVFATASEAGGTIDLISASRQLRGDGIHVTTGQLAGRQVAVARVGMGPSRAASGTTALVDGHAPASIVSVGFAGGLQPQLRRGDIMMVDEVVDQAGHAFATRLDIDAEQVKQQPALHVGRLLTVDRLICKPDEKRSLGEETGAVAVDMETVAVAGVCAQRGVPLVAVRIISDAMDEALPRELALAVQQPRAIRKAGIAVGALWRRPSSVKDYWKIRQQGLVLSDRLGRFLSGVVAQLPAAPEDKDE